MAGILIFGDDTYMSIRDDLVKCATTFMQILLYNQYKLYIIASNSMVMECKCNAMYCIEIKSPPFHQDLHHWIVY
jgi:hypothetical protein